MHEQVPAGGVGARSGVFHLPSARPLVIVVAIAGSNCVESSHWALVCGARGNSSSRRSSARSSASSASDRSATSGLAGVRCGWRLACSQPCAGCSWLYLLGGCGVILQSAQPFCAHLFVHQRALLMNGTPGVISHDRIEEFLNHFGTFPVTEVHQMFDFYR